MGRCAADAGCTLFQYAKVVVGRHQGSVSKATRLLTTTAGLIIACVALWSAIGAMMDGRKAVRIAEWTAKKDYREFCETIENREDGCDRVTRTPLGPPPISWTRLQVRALQQAMSQRMETFPGSTIILLGFPLALISLWVALRTKIKRVLRRRLPYWPSEDHQRTGLLAGEARELLRLTPLSTAAGASSGVDFRQSSMESASHRAVFGSGLDNSFDFKPALTTSLPSLQMDSGISSAFKRAPSGRLGRRKRETMHHYSPVLPLVPWPVPSSVDPSTSIPILSCRVCKSTLDLALDEPLAYYWKHADHHLASWCWPCTGKALGRLCCDHADCLCKPPHGMSQHIREFLEINEMDQEKLNDGREDRAASPLIWYKGNFDDFIETILYRVYFVQTDPGINEQNVPWMNATGGILCHWRRDEIKLAPHYDRRFLLMDMDEEDWSSTNSSFAPCWKEILRMRFQKSGQHRLKDPF
ncbi:hypothetical protein QBC36DRAFT_195202 [Triangularia setosa]|uniref:Uncharacterized protein n=1 Tax=Triangularia setosa TaxID=2587417 RepID=A0AAN6W0V6_9PEZI|nr:hypothetical protein QBC36DRAFT_195202 [Podospora setosa]